MKIIWGLIFLFLSCNSFANVDNLKLFKLWEIEDEVFSYDGIQLYDSISNIQKNLKNCKKIDSDNWNYSCKNEKTVLLASNKGTISRFRVIEQMSLEEMTKIVTKLNNVYGPANIVVRNVKRPFDNHVHDDGHDSLFDSHFDASEPVSYTWYEKDSADCFSEECRGKELKIKYWFGKMILTVSDGSFGFYETQNVLNVDNLILSQKTSLMLGLSFAFNGILFLLLVIFYKNIFYDDNKDKLLVLKIILITLLVIVMLLNFFTVFVDLNLLGLILVFVIACLVGWYMSYKKVRF